MNGTENGTENDTDNGNIYGKGNGKRWNNLDNHLLFRGVERFWLFPLVDCRRLDRPTRMKPADT